MAKHRGKASLSQESQEFFKVYIPDLSHEHLRIPLAFVKVFKGNIPKTAVLRDIRGKCCHVELEEVEKDVFFKNGWQEFVMDHSVAEGDFLVFKYDGKVLFDVNIFGRSGCRKDESPDIDKTIIRVKREEDVEEETEEELTKPPHDCKLMQLEFGNDRAENSVSRGKSQRNSAIKSAECMRHEAASFVKPKNPHFIALIGRSSISNLHRIHRKRDLDTMLGSLDRIVQVEGGKSYKPCVTLVLKIPMLVLDTHACFKYEFQEWQYMIQSSVSCIRCNQFIPRHVLKKNNIKLEKEMVVRDQKRRLWPMGLSTRKDGRLALVKGWTNFWRANNVRAGDQCVFEFILGRGRITKEIHVQVIHATKRVKNPRGN